MALDHVDYGMEYDGMEVMMENSHEAEKQILDRDFFNGAWDFAPKYGRPIRLDAGRWLRPTCFAADL
jgi:hypothetical protein